MTRISFVANVGGLLGLCMGFSLVSAAEIVYFCCKRKTSMGHTRIKEFWDRRKTRRSNNGNIPRRSKTQDTSHSMDFDHVETDLRVNLEGTESA